MVPVHQTQEEEIKSVKYSFYLLKIIIIILKSIYTYYFEKPFLVY